METYAVIAEPLLYLILSTNDPKFKGSNPEV